MMADDRTPLLSDGDGSSGDGDVRRRQVKRLYESDESLRNGLTDGSRVIRVSPGGHVSRHLEVDRIVGVFTVAFDTRSGNVIEWCLPDDLDLDGVEFKAMTSGSHTLRRDFVYFRKGSLFGLACFENMKVESEIERGARMKSVGVLATSYTVLYRHMQFLETQVRNQLQNPGDYNKLIAFYTDKKATLETADGSVRSLSPSHTKLDILPELKITHPAGCFTQFFQFFGEQIFVLWKYVLLRKRILFCSPPPIGVVCYRVYCCCCLGNHGVNIHVSPESRLEPHFYVNVADIDALETELSYIACTTEKIFGSKPQLWDVYVDNQNVRVNDAVLRDLLKVNSADRDKQAQLNNLRTSRLFSIEEFGDDPEAVDEEDLFTAFFTEQNNRLFQTLLDLSQSGDRTLTNDHMRDMGLDPVGDRTFIMELLETYGIDVILMVDNPCCPT